MRRINTSVIQEVMDANKITYQEMAEALGYKNASSFLRFLRGEYQFRANHVPILMEKLNLTMEDLYREDGFAKIAK